VSGSPSITSSPTTSARPSAVTLAGYVLGETTRLRVGTAAAILSNRHPLALAEETALLDAVSAGRFDLGVARGGPWIDLEVFGTGLARYADGFAESLDLLLAALDGRHAVKADGKHFRFPEVAMVPRPAGRVPVWVAATSSSTVDIAARRGLPLLMGMHDDDDAKAAMLDGYAGPSDVPHASAHLALVTDTTEQAEKALRAAMPGWLARTGEYRRIPASTGASTTAHPASATWPPTSTTCSRRIPSGRRSAASNASPPPSTQPACGGCSSWSRAPATRTAPPIPSTGSAPKSCHRCASTARLRTDARHAPAGRQGRPDGRIPDAPTSGRRR
jgi:alkanesulfonate monooxygenase SsuD/methylene tetrahydromethanopterin reductase-like flavin-dependent oxidoreductase (luciferase family)